MSQTQQYEHNHIQNALQINKRNERQIAADILPKEGLFPSDDPNSISRSGFKLFKKRPSTYEPSSSNDNKKQLQFQLQLKQLQQQHSAQQHNMSQILQQTQQFTDNSSRKKQTYEVRIEDTELLELRREFQGSQLAYDNPGEFDVRITKYCKELDELCFTNQHKQKYLMKLLERNTSETQISSNHARSCMSNVQESFNEFSSCKNTILMQSYSQGEANLELEQYTQQLSQLEEKLEKESDMERILVHKQNDLENTLLCLKQVSDETQEILIKYTKELETVRQHRKIFIEQVKQRQIDSKKQINQSQQYEMHRRMRSTTYNQQQQSYLQDNNLEGYQGVIDMNDSLFQGNKLKDLKQQKRDTLRIIHQLTQQHNIDMQLKLNSRQDILEYIQILQQIPLDHNSNNNLLQHLQFMQGQNSTRKHKSTKSPLNRQVFQQTLKQSFSSKILQLQSADKFEKISQEQNSLPMLGLISQKPSQSMSPTASSSHRSRHRLDTSMMLKYSSSEEYQKIIDDFLDKNNGDLTVLVNTFIKSLRDIRESNDFLATTIENLQLIKNGLENEFKEIDELVATRDVDGLREAQENDQEQQQQKENEGIQLNQDITVKTQKEINNNDTSQATQGVLKIATATSTAKNIPYPSENAATDAMIFLNYCLLFLSQSLLRLCRILRVVKQLMQPSQQQDISVGSKLLFSNVEDAVQFAGSISSLTKKSNTPVKDEECDKVDTQSIKRDDSIDSPTRLRETSYKRKDTIDSPTRIKNTKSSDSIRKISKTKKQSRTAVADGEMRISLIKAIFMKELQLTSQKDIDALSQILDTLKRDSAVLYFCQIDAISQHVQETKKEFEDQKLIAITSENQPCTFRGIIEVVKDRLPILQDIAHKQQNYFFTTVMDHHSSIISQTITNNHDINLELLNVAKRPLELVQQDKEQSQEDEILSSPLLKSSSSKRIKLLQSSPRNNHKFKIVVTNDNASDQQQQQLNAADEVDEQMFISMERKTLKKTFPSNREILMESNSCNSSMLIFQRRKQTSSSLAGIIETQANKRQQQQQPQQQLQQLSQEQHLRQQTKVIYHIKKEELVNELQQCLKIRKEFQKKINPKNNEQQQQYTDNSQSMVYSSKERRNSYSSQKQISYHGQEQPIKTIIQENSKKKLEVDYISSYTGGNNSYYHNTIDNNNRQIASSSSRYGIQPLRQQQQCQSYQQQSSKVRSTASNSIVHDQQDYQGIQTIGMIRKSSLPSISKYIITTANKVSFDRIKQINSAFENNNNNTNNDFNTRIGESQNSIDRRSASGARNSSIEYDETINKQVGNVRNVQISRNIESSMLSTSMDRKTSQFYRKSSNSSRSEAVQNSEASKNKVIQELKLKVIAAYSRKPSIPKQNQLDQKENDIVSNQQYKQFRIPE